MSNNLAFEGVLHLLNVDLVYADLMSAHKEIKEERVNPAKIRRLLMQFTTLSQKLTESMRNEYKQFTGSKWVSGGFKGWNKVTDVFKELRNEDYHEIPVVIDILGIYEFPNFPGRLRSAYTFDNQTISDIISPSMQFTSRTTGLKTNYEPVKSELNFFIKPRTDKMRRLLLAAGSMGADFSTDSNSPNKDIHELCDICAKTLTEYYIYYNSELEKNKK